MKGTDLWDIWPWQVKAWWDTVDRVRAGPLRGGFPPISRGVLIVTVGVTADSPHHEMRSRLSRALRAEVGDTLIIEVRGPAGIPRVGEIVAVTSPDGSPPYRVRWLAGEYESVISPGPGARVEKGH